MADLSQTARNPSQDFIRATPRNPVLGFLSDIVGASYSPQRTQQMQGMANFFGAPAISQTLDRLSFGEPLTTGAGGFGGTTSIRPEAIEAGITLAPFMGLAARMTKGLPVGMGIKDVGKKNIDVSLNEASNFLSAKSEFGQVGGTIRPPDRLSDKPYLQINYAEVEKASRGLGKGKELYQSLVDDALARGLRVYSDSTVEKSAVNVYKSLGKKDFQLKDMTRGSLEDGAVYGAGAKSPAFEILPKQSFQYPQDEALRLAQQRAALPIEQGGLGLPANNTPAQRAAAMEFDAGFYHGSPESNIKSFITNQHDETPVLGVAATKYPDYAAYYAAGRENLPKLENAGTIYPINIRRGSNAPTFSDKPFANDQQLESAFGNEFNLAVNNLAKQNNITTINPLGGLDEVFVLNPENIRSRFAAFDPFRRNAAVAAAMGVAAPNLLAAEQPSGPKQTWDAYAAQKAKMLEDMGRDPKSIWQETGTWRGTDGKLRQEIMP